MIAGSIHVDYAKSGRARNQSYSVGPVRVGRLPGQAAEITLDRDTISVCPRAKSMCRWGAMALPCPAPTGGDHTGDISGPPCRPRRR